jgi:hypothetical protein
MTQNYNSHWRWNWTNPTKNYFKIAAGNANEKLCLPKFFTNKWRKRTFIC